MAGTRETQGPLPAVAPCNGRLFQAEGDSDFLCNSLTR